MLDQSADCLATLRERGVTEPIGLAIVLGTGLGAIAEALDGPLAVPYADLPGFPRSTVSGHDGQLVVGRWEGVPLAVLQGRSHYYETGNAATMLTPLATLKGLGAHTLVLTNAAGSVNLDWYPGNIAMISDHINLTGVNPLVGAEGDARFVALAEAYDPTLRTRMRRAAVAGGVPNLREGTYMFFPGPSFETPSEVKIAKTLGADLVGMSTVPEVVLARWLGMRVLALSVVTNFATGISGGNPTHAETKQAALMGAVALRRLLRAFVRSSLAAG